MSGGLFRVGRKKRSQVFEAVEIPAFRGSEDVFVHNLSFHLGAQNGDMTGSIDSDTGQLAGDLNESDDDLVADVNGFPRLSRQHQHGILPYCIKLVKSRFSEPERERKFYNYTTGEVAGKGKTFRVHAGTQEIRKERLPI